MLEEASGEGSLGCRAGHLCHCIGAREDRLRQAEPRSQAIAPASPVPLSPGQCSALCQGTANRDEILKPLERSGFGDTDRAEDRDCPLPATARRQAPAAKTLNPPDAFIPYSPNFDFYLKPASDPDKGVMFCP